MSDNVILDAGSNPTIPIATDEASDGKHYQKVKLIDPTADSVLPIGTITNPMKVSVTNSVSVEQGSPPWQVQSNGADVATENTLLSIDSKIAACNTSSVTIAALPNEGQQTMANSISVAIAPNQSTVSVNGACIS